MTEKGWWPFLGQEPEFQPDRSLTLLARDLCGQVNGAKSLAVKDHTIWTGGLDARLCSWDLRMVQEPLVYLFESQVCGCGKALVTGSSCPLVRTSWTLGRALGPSQSK